MIKTHIVIIDSNISNTCSLIETLKNKYGERNIHLFNTSDGGLNYLLNNLNQHMVVILDTNFPKNEKNGHAVFKELRRKTMLVPVIIWTSNDCSQNELIDFLNNRSCSFVKKNDSMEEILLELEKVVQSTSLNIDVVLEKWLERQSNKDNVMLVSKSGRSYTANQLIGEVRMQTEDGKRLVENINNLTLNLLFRGKEEI